MTDAERYAQIFRAAADGIASPEIELFKMIEAGTFRGGLPPSHWDAAKNGCTAFVRIRMTNERRDSDYLQWAAFDGVASMFEKIIEAEQAGA